MESEIESISDKIDGSVSGNPTVNYGAVDAQMDDVGLKHIKMTSESDGNVSGHSDDCLTRESPPDLTNMAPSSVAVTDAKPCSISYVFAASGLAAIGGLLFGYDTGIISGALLQLQGDFHLSCQESELVVSSMLFGALAASLVGGFLVDMWGRRLSILLNAALFIIGAVILAASFTFTTLLIGRLVVGFAVALSAIAECVYISEISPPGRRGMLVSLNELGITFGFLLAYIINYLCINVPDGWRMMFGLSIIPAIIQAVGMYFMPPSPRFLIIKGKLPEAKKVLQSLRGTTQVDAELAAIKTDVRDQQNSKMMQLCKTEDNMRDRMFISVGLVFFQQCTGAPNVLYYAPMIFQSIGFPGNTAATLATVGLGIVKVIFTAVALLTIDRVGRRKYLLAGAAMMFVGILSIGVVTEIWHEDFQVHDPCIQNFNNTLPNKTKVLALNIEATSNLSGPHRKLLTLPLGAYSEEHIGMWPQRELLAASATGEPLVPSTLNTKTSSGFSVGGRWVALCGMFLYISGYAIGFGPGSWLVLSEIFPSSLKGRAISLATVVNWSTNILISLTYLQAMSSMGVGLTFLGYGLVCIISIVFIFLCVPETKGSSLEEISEMLKHRSMKNQVLSSWPCCEKMFNSGDTPYRHMDVELNYSSESS